jgi:hypothetical protein
VEPYVAETDRYDYELDRFRFYGIVTGKTRADVVRRMEDLYGELGKLGDITVDTPFGIFRGYIKESIEVDWLGPAAADVRITFDGYTLNRSLYTSIAPADIGLHHMDNVSLVDYGAYVLKVENNFDRPDTKEDFSTDFDRPYQITRPGYKEFSLSLMFNRLSYTGLFQYISTFYTDLIRPGTRIMNVDGLERECFNFEGAKVRKIRIMPGLCIGEMTLPMALAFDGIPEEGRYLLDDADTAIASDDQNLISYQAENVTELADNEGRFIRNNEFENLTT